ncbi:hypothetical protein [Ursidibacter sp. B-7004-1]
MKNILFVIFIALSSKIMAHSSISFNLDKIPEDCYAEDIMEEIPMLMTNDDIFTVLDVVDVDLLDKRTNKLVCSAIFVTEKGNTQPYEITFTKNSMGKIIVSY